MKRLEFLDKSKSQELKEKGYCIFDLLSESDVKNLIQLFDSFHDKIPEGFYASTHLSNVEKRKQISSEILDLISEKALKQFSNIQLLGAAFISKSPGIRGILPLHQDWNIVDETEERSYNLWIPLVDVDEINGAIYVLESSHEKEHLYRGPGIPPIYTSLDNGLKEMMSLLKMKVGEALIYDHALWHYSPENNSEKGRSAVVIGVSCKDSNLRYYTGNNGVISEFEVKADFFLENNSNIEPENARFIQELNQNNEQISFKDFIKRFSNKSSKSLFKKVIDLIRR